MNKLKGKIVTGLGKGQYYISRDGYRTQFNLKLGFDPSPGTLNLKLAEPFLQPEADSIKIEGFIDAKEVHPTLYEAVGEAFNAVYGLSINA